MSAFQQQKFEINFEKKILLNVSQKLRPCKKLTVDVFEFAKGYFCKKFQYQNSKNLPKF